MAMKQHTVISAWNIYGTTDLDDLKQKSREKEYEVDLTHREKRMQAKCSQ